MTFTEQTARDFWVSLSGEQRMQLAVTACGPWQLIKSEGFEDEWCRQFVGGRVAVYEMGSWEMWHGRDYYIGDDGSPDAAKSAVDARLREMGFVLEDGE